MLRYLVFVNNTKTLSFYFMSKKNVKNLLVLAMFFSRCKKGYREKRKCICRGKESPSVEFRELSVRDIEGTGIYREVDVEAVEVGWTTPLGV